MRLDKRVHPCFHVFVPCMKLLLFPAGGPGGRGADLGTGEIEAPYPHRRGSGRGYSAVASSPTVFY